MHHRVERPARFVDAAEDRAGHFAEIAQVDPHRRHDRVFRQRLVDVQHVVAVGHQILEHGPPELAAAAGHDHFGHLLLLDRRIIPSAPELTSQRNCGRRASCPMNRN